MLVFTNRNDDNGNTKQSTCYPNFPGIGGGVRRAGDNFDQVAKEIEGKKQATDNSFLPK